MIRLTVPKNVKILEHLGTENPGRTASHFYARCPGIQPFFVNKAVQMLRKAKLITFEKNPWWPTSQVQLTAKGILAEVAEIKALAELPAPDGGGDPESAHGKERALWKCVLGAIKDGAPNAQSLAEAALKTTEINFRW
jgi:hypothetical protein